MAFDAHRNFAFSTVAVGSSPALSGTSLEVAEGTAGLFPPAPFNVVVWPMGEQPTAMNAEIVRVTAVAGDRFTIVRAQEGSSAQELSATDSVSAAITAKTLQDVEAAIEEATGAKGYLHIQDVAQTIWPITHGLGFDPAGIVVIDKDGFVLEGWDLQYLASGASLRLGFDIPVAGTARLS